MARPDFVVGVPVDATDLVQEHVMDTDFTLRPETEADHRQIREVHLAAFGSEQVPNLVDALRSAPAPIAPMSYVAVKDSRVIGHVMLSAGRLDAPRRLMNVLVLSPLGVLPQFHRRGIGTALVRYAVAAADEQRQPMVFLEGPPNYYGSRGFERASAAGFRSPSLRIPDASFQVVRLSAYEPWMTGTLVYSDPFWALDCVGLRDTASAPDSPAIGT
jgi:putative acetyltransferase